MNQRKYKKSLLKIINFDDVTKKNLKRTKSKLTTNS